MNAIKAKDTSKVLSPKQAERLQLRADAHFKINPGEKGVIATVDGNLFTANETGQHAAENHAQAIKSKIIILIEKGQKIEGGDSAEVTASGKPNPEQTKRINERADAYFKQHDAVKSILVTVDGNIFTNDEEGEHAAHNHAKKLVNTNVFEITEGEPIEGDKDSNEAAKEAANGLPDEVKYVVELVIENEIDNAKIEYEKLSDEHKKLLPATALAAVTQ